VTKRNDSSLGNRLNRSGETVTDARADGPPPPDESPTPESGDASHQCARLESIKLVERRVGLDFPLAGSLTVRSSAPTGMAAEGAANAVMA